MFWSFVFLVVVHFATSGGSGIANCEKNLRLAYLQIEWKAGKLQNGSLSKAELDEWLEDKYRLK